MEGMGRGGGGAKRRLKRMKRQGNEKADVVDSLMGIFMAHGIQVDFPWQITETVQELLESRVQQRPTISAQAPQAAIGDRTTKGHQPTKAPRGLLMEDEPPKKAVDPWANMVQSVLESDDEDEGDIDESYADEEEGVSGDMNAMIAAYEAGQARMAERVATQGVKYKNGVQGPASGQKIGPAPGTPATSAPSRSMQMIPPPEEGERRGKNGLTPSQARAMLSRVTGREVKPPSANPVPKPVT